MVPASGVPVSDWLGLLRRHPMFARYWAAEAISLGGDWFSLVAVSVLAVSEGGGEGAWAVAVTLAAHELPMAAMRPIAGVFADRFDRRNLLVGIHVAQLFLTLAMAAVAARGDLLALQALVVVRATVTGLDWPARSGALRRLVPEEELLAANALTGATWSAMYAIGMALGGVASTFGVPLALLIDAATFALAGGLLTTLPAMPTAGEGSLVAALRRATGDLVAAARLAVSRADLATAVAAKTPMALAGGAGVVMLNLIADRTAFAGSAAISLGLLQAARGIGTGLGPLAAERAIRRGASMDAVWALLIGCGLFGIAGVALSPPIAAVLLACAFVWGCGTGANWMLSSAELQRRAPDAAIGRLSGIDMLAVETSFAGSALLGGAVIEATGRPGMAAVIGVVLGAGGFLVLGAVRRRLPAPGPAAA